MRRIVMALASTVTGLVLLFSWPTSLNRSVAASGPTDGAAGTAGSGSSTGSTGSGTTGSGTTGSDATGSDATGSDSAGSDTTGSGTTGGTASGTTTAPDTSATQAPASSSQTYTGAAVRTRFGDVVVQITVTDGKLTDAQAIEYPNSNGRDQQINAYAIPILNSEAVAAGSASIQTVSGATFTSQGYVGSLQDALDQAGL